MRAITSESPFSLGVLVLACTATGYVVGGFGGNKSELQALAVKVDALQAQVGRVEGLLEDRWTERDMINWAERLADRNKEKIDVPTPRKK